MTVRELIEKLSQYNGDENVTVEASQNHHGGDSWCSGKANYVYFEDDSVVITDER